MTRPWGEGGPPPPEAGGGPRDAEQRERAQRNEERRLPEGEVRFEFVRSSGPGGQKVNKTSSKAQLRWNVGGSGSFTEEEKALIREAAAGRLTKDDDIVIAADTERSQAQNRDEALSRLRALIDDALTPSKERKATKPSRAERRRRLEEKRHRGETKRLRKPPKGDW